MSHVGVFLACLAIDFVCVKWISNVARKNKVEAMVYSSLCLVLSQTTTILCVHDYWLLFPACLGGAVGTYLAMTYGDLTWTHSCSLIASVLSTSVSTVSSLFWTKWKRWTTRLSTVYMQRWQKWLPNFTKWIRS